MITSTGLAAPRSERVSDGRRLAVAVLVLVTAASCAGAQSVKTRTSPPRFATWHADARVVVGGNALNPHDKLTLVQALVAFAGDKGFAVELWAGVHARQAVADRSGWQVEACRAEGDAITVRVSGPDRDTVLSGARNTASVLQSIVGSDQQSLAPEQRIPGAVIQRGIVGAPTSRSEEMDCQAPDVASATSTSPIIVGPPESASTIPSTSTTLSNR